MRLAAPSPTIRGSRCVPPHPGGIPSVTSGCAIFMRSDPSRMSHARATSQPPPRAKPLMAAITGTPRASMASHMPWPRAANSRAASTSIPAMRAMSAPAENARPAPVSTTARTPGSAATSSSAARRSPINSGEKAFRASWRSSTSTCTAPRRSRTTGTTRRPRPRGTTPCRSPGRRACRRRRRPGPAGRRHRRRESCRPPSPARHPRPRRPAVP